MDMRIQWLRCRATQRKYRNYWRAGANNLGDYVTKQNASTHYLTVRPTYFTTKSQLDLLSKKSRIKKNTNRGIKPQQGCARPVS